MTEGIPMGGGKFFLRKRLSFEILADVESESKMLQVPGQHVQTYYPGEIILQEGQPNDSMIYILVEGSLGVFKGGKEVAQIHERGSFLGELSAILNIDRTATVKAIQVSKICAVPYDPNVFFVRFPQLGVKLLQAALKRLANVTPQCDDFLQP